MPVYLVQGSRIDSGDAAFALQIASAYADRRRPRCLCVEARPEMYVTRLGKGFLVKRMPFTGCLHSPDCPSYEPPPESSGRDPKPVPAIRKDPISGTILLRLGFRMSKSEGRRVDGVPGHASCNASSDGSRLTMRGLLHFLWAEAELTHWHPAFASKRNWATVRNRVLQAAARKIVRRLALRARIYIPEVFDVEHRDELNARRVAQWADSFGRSPGGLTLLIGEVKEIAPARYGYKAVVKHVPDQAFSLDEALYRRIEKRFSQELSLWATAHSIHMMMIATFTVSNSAGPRIEEVSLMPVNAQWLPFDDGPELQRFERLVLEGRSFTKRVNYEVLTHC